jgi:hypothetical protein
MSYFFHFDPKQVPCYRNVSERCEHRNATGDSIIPGGEFVDQCNVATSFSMQSEYAFSKKSDSSYVPIPRDFLAMSRQPEHNPNVVPDPSVVTTDPGICARSKCKINAPDRLKHICFKCQAEQTNRRNHDMCM